MPDAVQHCCRSDKIWKNKIRWKSVNDCIHHFLRNWKDIWVCFYTTPRTQINISASGANNSGRLSMKYFYTHANTAYN
jgi:hypothetical protein